MCSLALSCTARSCPIVLLYCALPTAYPQQNTSTVLGYCRCQATVNPDSCSLYTVTILYEKRPFCMLPCRLNSAGKTTTEVFTFLLGFHNPSLNVHLTVSSLSRTPAGIESEWLRTAAILKRKRNQQSIDGPVYKEATFQKSVNQWIFRAKPHPSLKTSDIFKRNRNWSINSSAYHAKHQNANDLFISL